MKIHNKIIIRMLMNMDTCIITLSMLKLLNLITKLNYKKK